jgi:small subunit ribosomal protein S15
VDKKGNYIMPLSKELKDKIIKKYKVHENDTGSPQVQIAILTAEIDELNGHLKAHKHDFSSRRGLLRKVGQRKRLMKYLDKEDHPAYEEMMKKLKIKKIAQEEVLPQVKMNVPEEDVLVEEENLEEVTKEE